jgi:DNA-binding beta-propeller fold protein YncE
VTGDGVNDVLDALVTAMHSTGLGTLDPAQRIAADVNGSGVVDINDALLIAQDVVGLPVSLQCAHERFFVAESAPNQLTIIDHSTDTVTGSIALTFSPGRLAADPSRNTLYVADNVGARVQSVDMSQDSLGASFPVPGLVGDMAVTADGSTLVAVVNTGLAVIDLPAGTIRHQVALGTTNGNDHVATTPDSLHAWVTQNLANTVVEVDLVAGGALRTVPVGTAPFGVDVSPAGDVVWVVNNTDRTLSRIEIATGLETLPRAPLGAVPFGVVAHDNGDVFAVSCILAQVSRHDGGTGQPTGATYHCGFDPMEIVAASDGNLIVTDIYLAQVSIVDPATGTVVTVATAGRVIDAASNW